MMEGEAVEIFALTFNYLKPKVARTAPQKNLYLKKIEALRYRPLNFDALIQHQIQALIVWFFIIKNKEQAVRRLAEASQAQRKKFTANDDTSR
ncbi:hypothetical protein [Pedobacter sp. CFBP9032]|uniref:hypothetical protein n=1 Tax=Pedobacter sp. CFBP9032 TaxID=3096539 RepID=UPI002A69C4E8|nr:hypothetical protein [Pedobacter sp. CFBP9032]MDY0904609.1 hypothetical protein [Pedobacter sp. CFBP9032]